MAGNQDSGRVLAFRLSDKELETRIYEYKAMVDAEQIPRASWANFCAYLGYTEAEVAEVVTRGEEVKGAYYERAVMLKRMMTWVRGQLSSGKGWNGQNQSRAIFLMKQDHGDGVRYSDQDAKSNGPAQVKIVFGGDDPRAKKAGK